MNKTDITIHDRVLNSDYYTNIRAIVRQKLVFDLWFKFTMDS